MRRQERPLINYPMLLRIVGWLLMVEGAFMCVPVVTSILYNDGGMLAFAISAVLTFGAGAALTWGVKAHHSHMGRREGFLLTASVWVVFSLFGMLPFIISGTHLNVSDAFFEAMSGFTTTGASILTNIESLPKSVLIWRSLMQWIGGMGIILFTLAIIPKLNHSGGIQMFNAEVTGITHDKIRPRISQTAMGLWMVYIVLTIVLAVLLGLSEMGVFNGICHALTTISTGGFSTSNASIGAWDTPYIKIVITVFMFLGGVNFALIFKAACGNYKSVWHNEVFRAFVWIIVIMQVLFVAAISLGGNVHSWDDITIDPLFQIVSTITSTGYVAVDFETWGTFVLTLTFLMMFFGACAGSTSGGAKIDRMLFLGYNCRNELYRCIHPNSVMSVRISGKVMSPEMVNKAVAFLCIYVMLIMLGGIVLCTTGIPLVDSFFSAFSCIGNTGLGAGVTGYGGSFEVISDSGKWILSMLMLIGRLELYTVLILFTPAFWRR